MVKSKYMEGIFLPTTVTDGELTTEVSIPTVTIKLAANPDISIVFYGQDTIQNYPQKQ